MNGPLRQIFSLTVLLIWVLFGLSVAGGTWTGTQWLMLGLAHLACAVVFINFAYLFSYGYALSMVVVHLAILVLKPSVAAALVAGLGAAYGLRLWQFVHARYRHPSYAAIKARGDQGDAKMPLPARLFLWIAVSWLMTYAGMAAYQVATTGTLGGWVLAGAALMALGLVLETVADQQKQRAKAAAPGDFARSGLYARLRHPNYTGEMLFQAGLMVACLGSARGWLQYASCLIAPLYILILMYYAGRDADEQQARRYGDNPDYLTWRERTACFLPGW